MTEALIRSTFTINLTRGKQAFVDERDWYELRKFKWNARPSSKQPGSFYAVRAMRVDEIQKLGLLKGKRYSVHMHRQILGLGLGRKPEVDHKNHNTLDNRRANLRIVTHRQNMANSRNQSEHGVGVAFVKRTSRFLAHAWVDGRMVNIGMFANAEDAARARERFLSGKATPSEFKRKRKLSDDQVDEMLRQASEGVTISELSRKLSVSRKLLRDIIHNRIYRNRG